ncbi:UPF0104 family protein [Oscillatoria sp. CS-180]|uniref:lysylphosphatidylglycerol synthase transmembrane domain-containing protein n=1 Tax=Oscillatoria sp. CS-180 TaxID=3021720 RepID=UPI00232D7D9B|nr:UPF0104 family protein [Oscillatoria sp. CS-180]MDB9525742.1 UPF0104 family protein [Oscillatoria sp. CS-180]
MKIPKFLSLFKRFKPYVRWFILALTFGFILHTLRVNWQQILTVRFSPHVFPKLITALGVTLLAHVWSGWVWYWIVRLLNAPVSTTWAVITYLKTNLGKYLPGNVWHFVGRVQFLRSSGAPIGVSIVGVILEPVLMAVAALALVVAILPSTFLQSLILIGILVLVHPRVLNPILSRLAKTKMKQTDFEGQPIIPKLSNYPVKPLIGEVIFVVLRGSGFLLCFLSLDVITIRDSWVILGAFSFAWLLGLVVPGAPGGLGVFEATALAVLTPQFPVEIVLGAVALYRLNSTLAEVLGAGLAFIDERWNLILARRSPEPTPSRGMISSQVTSTDA